MLTEFHRGGRRGLERRGVAGVVQQQGALDGAADLLGPWQAMPAALATLAALSLAVLEPRRLHSLRLAVGAFRVLLVLGVLLDNDRVRVVHLLYLPTLALL